MRGSVWRLAINEVWPEKSTGLEKRRRLKDSGRSPDTYIYIYREWQNPKPTRRCGARSSSPQSCVGCSTCSHCTDEECSMKWFSCCTTRKIVCPSTSSCLPKKATPALIAARRFLSTLLWAIVWAPGKGPFVRVSAMPPSKGIWRWDLPSSEVFAFSRSQLRAVSIQ